MKISLIWTQDENNLDKMKTLTKSVVWPNMNLKYFVCMKVCNKLSVNFILTGVGFSDFQFNGRFEPDFVNKLEDKTWLTIVAALRSVLLVHIYLMLETNQKVLDYASTAAAHLSQYFFSKGHSKWTWILM